MLYYQTQLGKLYHGDCLELMKNIEDKSIDMIFTDPPYGHNNNNNGDLISRREAVLGKGNYIPERDNIPILNDGKEADEIFKAFLVETNRILKPGACLCCCCGGGGPDPQFARWSLWINEILQFKQMIIWDKGPMGMGWHYRRSYETILVAQKAGAACFWYDETNKIENVIRPGNYKIKKIIPNKKDHPTPKPIQLAIHFMKLHSKEGDVVLDAFSGGGSSLLAAEKTNRRWLGIELDEKYCNLAKERLEKETEQLKLF